MTGSAPAAVLFGDLLGALDACALAELAGLEPDPWQVAALRSRAPRALWNCCRQSGKSSIAAVLACHQALYAPGSLVLLISPSERQSKELMAKVAEVFAAAGRPVPADGETKLTLELSTGSRVVALPGTEKTTRGYSAPALVVVDEASRVEDDLYHALTPMLATSPAARLVALSTPNGMLGWWYQCWTTGGDVWERVEVPASQCPRISSAFLELERASMPASVYAQEYLCQFSQLEDGAFRAEDVYAMISDDVHPRFDIPPPAFSAGDPPPAPADVDLTPYLTP